ncbi:hypothetical protein [Aeromicrobium sp. 50.2.37]|jgi:hypothetical protein|uniref:hypothetical protein n=1 Tax=Aeromicrobium sp. 50.2.37 TaxID=2969305 RepID=UPI00214FA90A|nr:hypothetical protein [Aeromicrobium sp. 50.2.37]MCR4511735.1 hypothetical protein [Aeromicrobium sp. 50.2.37]
MSTRPGRIHVVDDHAGLTRNIFASTFTDLPAGRVGVWARPDTARMNVLSMDLMSAYGVQDGFHGNGRPAQARLEHVVAWARAHHTRHVYVQNAFLPRHPVIAAFLTTAIGVGWDIWLVGDTGYRTTVQATIEDFCRNNHLEAPLEVTAGTFLSTFHLDHPPSATTAPDDVHAVKPPSAWPEHLPSDDFPTFRAACRDLLTPEAFAEVDQFFVRYVRAGIKLASTLPDGMTEREEAIAAYLQHQWHQVESVSHFMVVIRATQVALFKSQLYMRVVLNRLLGTAETMPHEALREPEPWQRLRAYADPARGATCAVAATGADPDELLGLRMSDVAPDGSTLRMPEGTVNVFEHAQVFIRAFREVRLLDGANGDDLFFATPEGPMPEVRIRRYLRDARREVDMVVTAPMKLWDRSDGSRWYTRWGLTIREVA